jgi:hypothetical protein
MRMLQLSVTLLAGLLVAVPAWPQDSAPESSPPDSTEVVKASSQWRFSIRPYVFLSGLNGSVTVDPLTFPINSSFSDLLDNLRFGGFLAFSAEKGRWGFYTDLAYIDLIGQSSSARDAELELENFIAEADGTVQPGRASILKFLAGVRVYSIVQTLRFRDEPYSEVKTTVVDPIVGAKGEWNISDHWDFELRGDIGGFGVSSEFTYQGYGLVRWNISHTVGLPLGYRILGYSIKTGDIWMNTQMSGLMLGLDFRF